ncbi:endospore germination permease [Paenibacillus sp. 5J-6]|uniref:Endospore germination permease n=1 Tax=Paenibacillus silvestris TaxID=2606219 RepID=A0A6L8UZ62_9BACL|nr:endospore germination permease [Paenibacillus silvestris]MZQ83267.1 endospore germination permease [Paenibacillus silvestris]
MEKTSISTIQMFFMTTCYVVGTTFLLLPTATIMDTKQYGWIVQLWSTVFGVAIGAIWIYLSSQHPGLSLVEISRKVMGKYVGGFISLCYIILFLQITSWVTRNISDFMHVTLMPRTPETVFHIVALFVCAYAVVKGIRTIALVSILVVPFICITFWVPFTIMLKEWDWRNFAIPPYDFPLWPTVAKTKYALGFPFMETISFMMIFPLIRQKLKTAFLGGTVFAGLQIAISVLFIIGILGVYRSSHLLYPEYVVFREMEFSSFLEHLESVLSVNTILVVYVKLSLIYYFTVTAICQLFSVQNRALVAYPLAWVISGYATLFSNVSENAAWVHTYLFIYYVPFAIGFPFLLIAVSWLRKMGKREKQIA